jgi:hypothetical protein
LDGFDDLGEEEFVDGVGNDSGISNVGEVPGGVWFVLGEGS